MNKIKMALLFILRAEDTRNKFKIIKYSFNNFLKRLNLPVKFNDIMELEFKDLKICFRSFSSELAPYKEIYINKVYEIDSCFIPDENSVIFDIGANIGFYSIRQAKRACKGKVYAFEPNPFAFERLKKNVFLNKLSNVVVNQVAVSDKQGKIKFSFNERSTTLSRVIDKDDAFEVESITLDDFVSEYQINKIDIMKIDTEGSEFEVLRGAEKTLKLTNKIVLEYHSGELKDRITSLLEKNGFEKVYEEKKNSILYFANTRFKEGIMRNSVNNSIQIDNKKK